MTRVVRLLFQPALVYHPRMGSQLVRQFSVFSMMGALGTACHYLVLVGCVQLAHLGPTLAATLGYCTGAIVNYVLNRRVTFRSTRAHAVAGPRYVTIVLLGLAINTAMMALLTARLGLHYLFSQVLCTGLVLMMNFVVSKFWVFGG
jgi:putative flippase GtrA